MKNFRANLKNNSWIFALAALFLFAVLIAMGGGQVAYAAENTFEVVFPTVSYFQSQDPSLIAANDSYLVVYDGVAGALFVRNNFDSSTYSYPIALENVTTLLALADHAFIIANERYYTLDLRDRSAQIEEKTLPTPANVSSVTSDGTYLYAKSTGGYLSIYDEDLTIAEEFSVDNLYDRDVLPGYAALAAEDGMLYVLATDDKNAPRMFAYDCRTKSAELVDGYSYYVQAAYVGDVIYAQISDNEEIVNHGKLCVLNKATGELMFVSDIRLTGFCAYDKHLYATSGGSVTIYSLTEDMDGLYEDYTISMSGSDLSHLDAPSDAVKVGARTIVADSGNHRVACLDAEFNMTPVEFESAPIRVASDGKDVFTLLEDGSVHRIAADFTASELVGGGSDFLDIAYLDSLYAITRDEFYVMVAGRLVKHADITDALRVTVAPNGKNVYVMREGGIDVFNAEGERLSTTLIADFSQAKDFAVDYAGNIFVAYEDRIEKYANTLTSLEKVNSVSLVNATAKATLTSLFLDGKTAYFTAKECLVGRLTLDAVTKEDYEVKEPALPSDPAYRFAHLKEGVSSFVLEADGRPESVEAATSETVIILDISTNVEGMSYALRGERLLLVKEADYDILQPQRLSSEQDGVGYAYSVAEGATLYTLPYIGSSVVTTEKTAFEAAYSTLGYDDDKWVFVRLDGKDYFVSAEELITTSSEPSREDDKVVKGRANADRVGGLVGLYSDVKLTQELRQLVDGAKISVLEDYGDCYLVSYGDLVGYMRKDDVVINGLTTSQTVAIILAVIVMLTGVGIFIAIYLTRRHIEEGESKR